MKGLVAMVILAWLLLGAAEPIPFNVGKATPDSYTTFLSSFREKASVRYTKDKKTGKVVETFVKCYEIPMLPPSTDTPKYLLVELKSSEDKSVTLVLRRTDLYLLGYSDTFNGKCRYHIFSDYKGDERKGAENELCPNTRPREEEKINYESNYKGIQAAAKVGDRSNFELGIGLLNSRIGKISDGEKNEAEFLLTAIQMVAEAARFSYIEQQVKINFKRPFSPDSKVIELEQEWGKISTAIHGAKNGAIRPPLPLKNYDPTPVLRVDELERDIKLLNYNEGDCQPRKFYAMVVDEL